MTSAYQLFCLTDWLALECQYFMLVLRRERRERAWRPIQYLDPLLFPCFLYFSLMCSYPSFKGKKLGQSSWNVKCQAGRDGRFCSSNLNCTQEKNKVALNSKVGQQKGTFILIGNKWDAWIRLLWPGTLELMFTYSRTLWRNDSANAMANI